MNDQKADFRESPHGKGYIRVYRKLLTSAVFQDEGTLKVWMWCLLRANYSPRPMDFAGEQVELKRGEFITGRIHASAELGMSESRTWRLIKKLEHWGNIRVKSNNKFSVVSILKYDTYQTDDSQAEQPLDNQRTTSEQPADTDKEYKNQKKEKKEREARPTDLDSVKKLFQERNYPAPQAEIFWHHYCSNGWKVGKNPMVDWKAAAAGWISRAKEYSGKHEETREERNARMAAALK